MKKLFLLVSLMFAAVSSRAEVVIYTQTYSETVTGDGYTVTTNFTGYFVFDSQGTVATLDARTLKVGRTSSKLVTTQTADEYVSDYLDSKILQQTLAIIQQHDAGATLIKGKSSVLNLGNGQTFNAPKSFSLSGFFRTGEFPFPVLLHEFKGTMTFNATLTKAHNISSNSITATVAALKTALAAKGYAPTN